MDINLVKNVINDVNLVKIGHFWSKWSKLGHFGGKNDVICQNLAKVVKNCLLRFLKIISVRFMDINLVKIVINGVNLVQIGNFRRKCSKFPPFLGVKVTSYVKILGKWSKNFFTQKFEY